MTRLPAFRRPDQFFLSRSSLAWLATAAALTLGAAVGSVVAALAAAGAALAVHRLAPLRAAACVIALGALAVLLSRWQPAHATSGAMVAIVMLVGTSVAAVRLHGQARGTFAGAILRRAHRRRHAEPQGQAPGRTSPFPGVGVDAGRAWRRATTPVTGTDIVVRPRVQGDDVVRRFLRDLRDALGADATFYWRANLFDDALELTATSHEAGGPPPAETPASVDPLIRWAAQERMVVSNSDDATDLFLAAPVGKGESIHGVLGLRVERRTQLSRERARPWLGRAASHLARLIELVDEAHAARRYRDKSQRLLHAAEMVQRRLELDDLAEAICTAALNVTAATRAAFILWDERRDEGHVHRTSSGHPIPNGLPVTGRALFAAACRDGQSYAIRDARRMARDAVLYGPAEPHRLPASLAVVSLVSQRVVKGAIVVEGDTPLQLTAVEVDLLRMLATHAVVALENTRHFQRAAELATVDPLTSLVNRRGFEAKLHEHLEATDRYGLPTSLLLLDIDHFKAVNDTYGHDAGDAVLVAVALTIQKTVRALNVAARQGGEEFAVLLPGTGLWEAEEAAERLRSALGERLIPAGRNRLRVTVSLGVACYPQSTTERAGLVAQADRALYDAKRGGRNCVRCATPVAATESGDEDGGGDDSRENDW